MKIDGFPEMDYTQYFILIYHSLYAFCAFLLILFNFMKLLSGLKCDISGFLLFLRFNLFFNWSQPAMPFVHLDKSAKQVNKLFSFRNVSVTIEIIHLSVIIADVILCFSALCGAFFFFLHCKTRTDLFMFPSYLCAYWMINVISEINTLLTFIVYFVRS